MKRALLAVLSLLVSGPLVSAAAPGECAEGCTPGYWKNHPERWDGAGGDDFTHTLQHFLSFNAVLGVSPAQSSLGDEVTLLDAAGIGGGGINALNRHTAAALASADTSIFYPFEVAQVIALYQDAVGAVPGPESVGSVHGIFEDANELGCPLSNSWQPKGQICTYCYGGEGDCPCGGSYAQGGCPNSTGVGAIASGSGTGSIADDDLVLTAIQLPPNKPVIWFMAPRTNRYPLADGLLCVHPGELKIIRFPPSLSNGDGVNTFGPGVVQASIDHPVAIAEIKPGSTWNFQCYYRDPQGPCGSGANTTNAVRVEFY